MSLVVFFFSVRTFQRSVHPFSTPSLEERESAGRTRAAQRVLEDEVREKMHPLAVYPQFWRLLEEACHRWTSSPQIRLSSKFRKLPESAPTPQC